MAQRKASAFRFPLQKYWDEKAIYTNFRYLQEYLRNLNVGDKVGATFVISHPDSKFPEGAHYRASGSEDNETVQEAVDALPADGGTIYLAEGEFSIEATLSLPGKKIVFTGPGTLNFKGATTAFDGGFAGTTGGVYIFTNLSFTGDIRTISDPLQGAPLFTSGGGCEWVSIGCHYYDISASYFWGAQGLGVFSEVIVVGNTLQDIELRRGVGASPSSFLIGKDGGGSRQADGIFAGNFLDGLTVHLGGGGTNSAYLAFSASGSDIYFANNTLRDVSGLTSNFGGTAIDSHNVINGAMVSGTHVGADHGSLTGLTDDDHTQYVLHSLLTTRGDTFRRGASAIERLALGTDGQVLTSDGVDVAWETVSGLPEGDEGDILYWKDPVAGTVVASVTRTIHDQISTHPNNLPATVDAGDLLLLIHTNDGTSSAREQTIGAGWTRIGTHPFGANMGSSVYYRIADGSEGGGTISVSIAGGTEDGVGHIYRITGWHGTTPPELSEQQQSNTPSPECPALNPSWGNEETIYFVAACVDNAFNDPIDAAPTNYTTNFVTDESGTDSNSCKMGSSYRIVTADSEDPGPFTGLAAGDESVTYTIAVRGNIGGGSGSWEKLAIGTTGQVLTVAGGLPSWATP